MARVRSRGPHRFKNRPVREEGSKAFLRGFEDHSSLLCSGETLLNKVIARCFFFSVSLASFEGTKAAGACGSEGSSTTEEDGSTVFNALIMFFAVSSASESRERTSCGKIPSDSRAGWSHLYFPNRSCACSHISTTSMKDGFWTPRSRTCLCTFRS